MIRQLKARAPAKLILSGEHAVIYGQPALAMAVDFYTETTTTWHKMPVINFEFLDLKYAKMHTIQALDKLNTSLHKNYIEFRNGHCNIREVLMRPFELLQYSVGNLFEKLNLQLPRGVEIKVNSTIPIGCGLGSSAAAIMSTLFALSHMLNLNLDLKRFLMLGQEAENLQHGSSSGIDLQLAAFGGSIRFQHGETIKREVPKVPLHLVNTGIPEATTGECVAKVASFFKKGGLALDFAGVTDAMDQVLMSHDIGAVQTVVQANHQLLMHIGVVPDKVSLFVDEIEKHGGAAKICGAGSVIGDNAGVLLVVGEHNVLSEDTERFGYQLKPLQADLYGVRII